MELVYLIRAVWRRKLLVAIGVPLALAAAFAIGPAPPSSSAVAWTRVVLDTPKSQLVDSAPKAADSLPWRAGLLVHLLATEEHQKAIAAKLGVTRAEVNTNDPALQFPEVAASLPSKAAEGATSYAPYQLTATIPNDSLPMIALEAAAPDAPRAKKLAEAAVAVLVEQSSKAGTYSTPIQTGGVNELEAFEVESIAPVHTKVVVTSKGPIKAIAAALFVLFGWATAVVAAPALLRRISVHRREMRTT